MSETTSTGTTALDEVAGAVRLWHSLAVRDADAMIAWMEAIGLRRHAVHRDPEDPSQVVHAQMVWPRGGGVMFGTEDPDGDLGKRAGTSAAYLVLAADDDVEAVHAAALAAGGREVRAVHEPPYGGRASSVADPEGGVWSCGTYQPGTPAPS